METKEELPSEDHTNKCDIVQKADKVVKESTGNILIPLQRGLRLFRNYYSWRLKHSEDYLTRPLPQHKGLEIIDPDFFESICRRIKTQLDKEGECNYTSEYEKMRLFKIFSARSHDVPFFNRAMVQTFEGIEEDSSFDPHFLLKNLTEEINTAIKAIYAKTNEYKIAEDIQRQYQHVIDNDELLAFVMKRLLKEGDFNMVIRTKDYRNVIRTYECFRRIFQPVFTQKFGEKSAMILLDLIKSHCDPKTESITLYNLIEACKNFIMPELERVRLAGRIGLTLEGSEK